MTGYWWRAGLEEVSCQVRPRLFRGLRDLVISGQLEPGARRAPRDPAAATCDSNAPDWIMRAMVTWIDRPGSARRPCGSTPVLYEDDFVVAMRDGHPFAADPSLRRYCEMQHLVVSMTGDPHRFVDDVFAQQRRSRRIALTAPNFMMALAIVAETDLVTALPRSFVAIHARRFGVVSREVPVRLPVFRIRAILPKVALMDAGLAWLFAMLRTAAEAKPPVRKRRGAK